MCNKFINLILKGKIFSEREPSGRKCKLSQRRQKKNRLLSERISKNMVNRIQSELKVTNIVGVDIKNSLWNNLFGPISARKLTAKYLLSTSFIALSLSLSLPLCLSLYIQLRTFLCLVNLILPVFRLSILPLLRLSHNYWISILVSLINLIEMLPYLISSVHPLLALVEKRKPVLLAIRIRL